jgi:hypothetical protein
MLVMAGCKANDKVFNAIIAFGMERFINKNQ